MTCGERVGVVTALVALGLLTTAARADVQGAGAQSACGATGREPSLSADWGQVAYTDPGLWLSEVSVLDCATGQRDFVSESSTGVANDDLAERPSISADGRFVAFQSLSTNLAENAADVNYDSEYEIYLHDRDTDADGVFGEPGRSAPGSRPSSGGSTSPRRAPSRR